MTTKSSPPALDATITPQTAVEVLLLSAKVLRLALHVLEHQAASETRDRVIAHLATATCETQVALAWQRGDRS